MMSPTSQILAVTRHDSNVNSVVELLTPRALGACIDLHQGQQ
jgi:hypothetical protein